MQWVIKFSHCLNFWCRWYGIIFSNLLYMLHSWRKKYVKWTTFNAFLKRVHFILFFSRKISFPFKCRKAIFQRFRRLKNQKFPLHMNHGHNTDFSKLVNLCPVKTFSLSLTPATHIMNQCWGLNATISKTNTFIYTAICVTIVSKDLFLYSTDSQIT